MKDYRLWIHIAIIGLCISLTVRIIAEAASGEVRRIEHLEGQLSVLNDRLLKIESKTHPATSKRFTADDAFMLEQRIATCVDNGEPMHKCLEARFTEQKKAK